MKFRDSFVAISVFLVCLAAPAAAQFPVFRAVAGVRAGYGSLGGDQFANLTDGAVFGAFVRLPIGHRFGIELSASGQIYRQRFLCPGFGPCLSLAESVIEGIHLAPLVRASIARTTFVMYGGPRVGLVFADFQDGNAGLETGFILGGAAPVYRDLAVDVSVVGGVVHVGTELPRSSVGQRLSFRVGFTYALREGPSRANR